MPAYVLLVDLFGIVLAAAGFTMAFRQDFVRRLIGRNGPSPAPQAKDAEDPLQYILRIAGVMIMVFGVVLAGMVTLFHFVQP